MHSRLMGLWRTTERSAGPVVCMDGGTRKMKRIIFSHFATETLKKKKELTQRQREYLPKVEHPYGLHLKHKLLFYYSKVHAKNTYYFYWVSENEFHCKSYDKAF